MLIHSKLSQCTDYRIASKSLLMACKSLMGQILVMAGILVMAEEIDQELLLVVINKTVLFQRIIKCFDD